MFSGSIVALVTPFNPNFEIDYQSFSTLIEWHISAGTNALVIAGTTGESPTLSQDDKVALAVEAVRISAGRIKVLIGNGGNNTAEVIALTKRLNNTGIDGYLTVTPYYNKPTNEGLIAHYSAIAQATDLPIILYNVPSRTQCDMSNEVVAKLSELSNIIGIKDATADLSRVEELAKNCVQPFILLSGDDATALEFCIKGGHGVISVTANIAPKTMHDIYHALENNHEQHAIKLDKQLLGLHEKLFIESSPMAVKWALYKLNRITNPDLRLPLTILSAAGQVCIEQVLKDSELYPQEF